MIIAQHKNKIIPTIILLLLALFMFTKGSTSQQVTQLNEHTVQSLDKTKLTAMTLSATAATASTIITLIPGEVGTPIAENLADISDYLLVVVAAIWLQKFLIGITGIIALKYLIPLSLLSLIAYVFSKKDIFVRLAIKMSIFAIFIFSIVPASVTLSNYIENNYHDSVQQTIDNAEAESKKLAGSEDQNSSSFWSNIVKSVKNFTTEMQIKFQATLSNMIDAVAVLIVTTCVIPILVLISFIWITKYLFGLTITTDIRKFSLVGKAIRKRSKPKTHL